jgi:hypothetical protein
MESGFGSVSATLVKTLCWFRVELRDHDHVVECVAWAPDSASEAINEAAAMDNKNRYQYLTYCTSRSDNYVGSVADPESGLKIRIRVIFPRA